MTNWQAHNLARIERLIASEPLPLVIIAEVLDLSLYTARNWQRQGLFQTEKRYEDREHRRGGYRWTQKRRMTFVTAVNYSAFIEDWEG